MLPHQYKLKSDKPNMSYADLHHVIMKNVKDIPQKTAGDHQKQQIGGKANDEEELVKYMSKLPSYLERGDKLQEKVLNVGVLDWGRLEKWQFSQKQVPFKHSGYSTSSSNTSSSFSMDGSSTYSSRGHSCSPAHLRIHRPSLQFHLTSSPTEEHSQVVKTVGEGVGRIQDIKTSDRNTTNEQEKIFSTAPAFCKNQIDVKLEECKKSDSETKNITSDEMASCRKVKMKPRDGEFTKRQENMPKQNSKNVKQDIHEGCKTVVLLLPRSRMESGHSSVSCNSNSSPFHGQRSSEARRRSFSDRPVHANLNSDIPHSCPLPQEIRYIESQVNHQSFADAASINFSTESSHSELQLKKMAKNLSKDRSSEESQVNQRSSADAARINFSTGSPHLDLQLKKMAKKKLSKDRSSEEKESTTTPTFLLPKELSKVSDPKSEGGPAGVSYNSNSAPFYGRRSAEACRRSFSDRSVHANLNSDIPHSFPLHQEVSIESHVKQPSSGNSAGINLASGSSHTELQLRKMAKNPSKDRSSEEKKSTTVPACLLPNEPSKVSDPKPTKAEKVQSTSPFCRFSSSMGSKISSISKDNSDVHNISTDVSAKSGSENVMASACLDASSNDRLTATGRARSSPLRRLLEPLLKPKAENCGRSLDPSERRSVSTGRACKSFDGQLGSSAMLSGKVKLDMIGCKTVYVNTSAKDKKHGPRTTVQALLRVVVKNGLPLLTLAVDKENDILAATMKKLNTTVMDDCSCIYTFFTIKEAKRKNGSWINQGGKGKAHDYIHNVVAQMKASDSQMSNMTPYNQFSMREFVLFSVDIRQPDNQTSVFQPNDELAAIVVKIPRKIVSSSIKHGQCNNKLSQVNLKESFSGVSCRPNLGENVQSQNFLSTPDFIKTTVILPSGIHSLPSKGGPSSLIERWSTGGSCDCGGWDLGCKLRILANQNQVLEKLSSARGSQVSNRIELLAEGGAQENQPLFSLAPFKDGVYSVEFSCSLSNLQAFSICIAVLDSRNICELSESCNSFEKKTSGETVSVQNSGTTASRIEGEVPRYVSYPPLSPVGRV